MFPTIPSKEVGVIIKDRNFNLGQKIREALRRGEKLYLVKKRKPHGSKSAY